MGDCVLTTPAISILKQARPDLAIAVVVEDRFAALFDGNPAVDAILRPDWRELRRWKPDLCLNLHGGGSSAKLTALSGSRLRAGFAHFRYQAVYNVRIPRAQEILGIERKVHTAEHLASAMFYLGAARVEIPRANLYAARPAAQVVRAPYAVIHPVASAENKTWPAECFREIADHLKSSLDLEPVFVGGPGEDLSVFRAWRMISGAPLDEIKSLIAGAALFLGNDSGPAHMAAAFGLPVVVLFGTSDSVIWGPWRTQAEVLASASGISSVSVQQVAAALEHLRVRV
jgi:ADP-heptose:LPS heptosyltransferase